MLAVTSAEALSILDHSVLKKTPSSFSSCMTLLSTPVASSWSPDNKYLFIASANTIHRYDPELNSLVDIFSSPETITSLIVKDKAFLIVGAGEKIHLLESGSTKVSQTITSHKDIVNALALSCDSTLLASTSSNATHIYNLTLASHTALRSLPEHECITTCAFHPHTRTRLLLGVGKKLIVYDINRPSGPLKTIPLTGTFSGHIGAISCSPFSKTLVAVATTGGTIGLVDLDKDKGLFRTINAKVPVASLSFSQEGASIYIGTENGKLLIVDLRALDKQPKCIVLSDTGARLATISVQSKVKPASEVPTKPEISKTVTSRKPSATILNKPSPARRVVSASLKYKGSAPSAGSPTPHAKEETILKKVYSPLRNPLCVNNGGAASPNPDDDFSLQINSPNAVRDSLKNGSRSKSVEEAVEQVREHTLSVLSNPNSNLSSRTREIGGPGKSARLHPPIRPSPSSTSASRYKVSPKENAPRRTRTISTASRTAVSSSLSASASKKVREDTGAVSQETRTVSTSSTQASKVARLSNATTPTAESISTGAKPIGTGADYLSAPKNTKKARSSPISNSNRRSVLRTRTVSSNSTLSQSKGTNTTLKTGKSSNLNNCIQSPDPSDQEALSISGPGPVTLLPDSKQRGMTSPAFCTSKELEVDEVADVDLLLRGGKSKKDTHKCKARTVLFQDHEKGSDNEQNEDRAGSDEESESEKENRREESLSWQISPRRPGSVGPSGVSSPSSWNRSPIRQSQSYSHLHKQYSNIPGSPGGTSPQDLLRNIVRDVMFDFHQESRAEMMGLHLDLVRMGRGWKKELRELMGEYGGELKELREENQKLREENQKLREENEKLRRGF